MPPKKATGTSKPAGTTATHASYRDMIKDAIINLKERNGSSRQALKKYVQNNNRINVTSQSAFDAQFNRAVKSGVEKGEFTQPKGPSGPLKLAKKEAKPAAKPAAKKAAAKPAAAKKEKAAAPKKTATKATTTKKAAAPKKTTAAKPKANVAKPRKAPSAPAVVDAPKVLGKTKSGRVTKSTAKPTPKKAAGTKKTTTKKSATPKKTEA
ncbi:hypothetical protein AJ79_08049 [Helicocarpus griseus UAMH5409]|uniref:Histone H1 n=1 Tax=Helicocarpus griseus UAMH5409 TaxID=1447875 RepID=A0A2B7WWC4_9EURO|nr:hypothetical protein AJ79_08049 [Helicocarpus griseus UAMH5409]